ncbi:MAG: transposase, partial [Candidatus Competibacteraceae bacterium]|nr:transposase [Candidatus Competibacteraceae bacterium]
TFPPCAVSSAPCVSAVRTPRPGAASPSIRRKICLPTSAEGRQRLRERVGVEHSLAHVAQRQGNHARYDGVVKNRLHLHLVCAIQNVERAQAFTAQKQADLPQAA